MFGIRFDSIRDVWYENLGKFPRKAAVVDVGAATSYAKCELLSERLRAHLAERFGLRPGDKVAIAGPNCRDCFLAYWAAVKHGAVVVPVNTRLGRDELRHILASTEARILIVHRASRLAVLEAAEGTGVEHVIGMGFEEDVAASFDSLLDIDAPEIDRPAIAEDDLAIIMHTSGTTGRPKGAMMRHGDLLFNNMLAVYAHQLRHDDAHLLVVPMFHPTAAYSLVPTSALLGSTLVMAPKSDVGALAALIQAHRATTFFGVPSLFRLLATWPQLDDFDLTSLRLIAYAGSPMPPATIALLRERLPGIALHNFFGLTETISMTHVLPDTAADTHPDSIGKLLPQVRQRILDEAGRDCAPGEVGELYFHRDNIICGYWKEPDRLAESIRGDWFDTGDLAGADEDGFVYIKGRSKDMIIVGGENVYALEVENCILQIEGVAEVAVVGVPATGARMHLGELVKAVIVRDPDAEIDIPDIKRHCMAHLATYKVPQLIDFASALPRNPGGKVLKRLLT